MGFLGSKKKHTSIVLIDIDSSSIGGALAHIEVDTPPTIYFTAREAIEPTEHEDASEAMLRTLTELAGILTTRGAPALRKESGSGHIDKILVSVGAPWQKTSVRTESISEPKPFVFTQAFLSEITKKDSKVPDGYVKSGESVIATLLNGYETPRPFGKKVSRADVIVLSSLLDAKVAQAVEKTLRKTYHTHALTLTAFASVAYSAFRDIYPHEKDFLVLEVSGEATDIAFVKGGLLVDVATITHGVNDLVRGASAKKATATENASVSNVSSLQIIDPSRNARFNAQIEETEKAWLMNIESALREASARHALPRTLFLLADTEAREYLRRLLDSSSMRSLWLTDDPLRVISVVPAHFAQFVKTRGTAEGDVYLELLTLFSKKGIER